jgi:hypothetical protein
MATTKPARPTDPLELMKEGAMPGTALPPPPATGPTESPVVEFSAEAAEPVAAPLPPRPAVPPPPAVAVERYRVTNGPRHVVLNRGRKSTIIQNGAIVSSASHDLAELRAFGVEMTSIA